MKAVRAAYSLRDQVQILGDYKQSGQNPQWRLEKPRIEVIETKGRKYYMKAANATKSKNYRIKKEN